MAVSNLVLLDNNCIRRLSRKDRDRLRANLRAMGAEFWPTAVNVLEALKSRDREKRTPMLTTLSILSGQHLVLPEPFEALRRVAEALVTNASEIDWSDDRLTYFLRNPDEVTDEEAAEARDYLVQQQERFRNIINHAEPLRPLLRAEGGNARWTSAAQFLDDVWWSRPENFAPIISTIFESWGLPSPPPVERLLAKESWRLFFDGWGAEMYARLVAHPQPRVVHAADLFQLIYMGAARNRVFASEDSSFRNLAGSILSGRYPLARMVPLAKLLE